MHHTVYLLRQRLLGSRQLLGQRGAGLIRLHAQRAQQGRHCLAYPLLPHCAARAKSKELCIHDTLLLLSRRTVADSMTLTMHGWVQGRVAESAHGL